MATQDDPKKVCVRCGKPMKSKGLCATHYSQYYKEIRVLSDEQKRIYDHELIEAGLLAPPEKPGPKADDPYAAVALKLFGKVQMASSMPESDERELNAEIDSEAKKGATKKVTESKTGFDGKAKRKKSS